MLPHNLPAFGAAGTRQHSSISDSIHPVPRAEPRLHDLRKSPARWLRGRLPRAIEFGANRHRNLRNVRDQIQRPLLIEAVAHEAKLSWRARARGGQNRTFSCNASLLVSPIG